MEEMIPVEEIIHTSWESLVIIGGIFLAVIIWVVISRGNSKND